MYKLELHTSELLMLQDLLVTDIRASLYDEVEYDDVDLMHFYLDRAKVLAKVKEELST
tara:strand:+ start:53 stop:226 length:174 start_codon:yes stop_codon:yes gene_type:complete